MGKDALNKRPLGVCTSPGNAENNSDVIIEDDNDTDSSSQTASLKRVIKPPVQPRPLLKPKDKGIFRTSVTEKLKEWRSMYPNYINFSFSSL